MPKKIHKLKDVSPENFKIICIASHQNDYRVSWALNKALKLKLQRANDHEVKDLKTQTVQKFTHYSWENKDLFLSYHLIANKSEQGYLFKDMPNIDYFLKISGDLENISLPEMVAKIKEISMVITAFELQKITATQEKRITFN
jgi:hypothetical protein